MQISEYTSGCPKQISELSKSVNNRVFFLNIHLPEHCLLNILWLFFIVCLSTDLRVSPSKAILTHPTDRSRISLRYILHFIIASSLWYFYFRYLFCSVNLFNLSCYQLNQTEKKLETKNKKQKKNTKNGNKMKETHMKWNFQTKDAQLKNIMGYLILPKDISRKANIRNNDRYGCSSERDSDKLLKDFYWKYMKGDELKNEIHSTWMSQGKRIHSFHFYCFRKNGFDS